MILSLTRTLSPPDPTHALLLVVVAGAGQYLPSRDPLQVTLSLSHTHSFYICSLLLDVAVGSGQYLDHLQVILSLSHTHTLSS